MAHLISLGEPAHEAELAAIRFLVEGLPRNYTVYANAWLVERTGVVYELDAIVVAPHALYVVEMKAFRGAIEGNDHDWYVPYPITSPLKLNRKTAQILSSTLRREDFQAGRPWVEGFVFLSNASSVQVRGPASRDRIHDKSTILAALQDKDLVRRLSRRSHPAPVSTATEKVLLQLLQGQPRNKRPTPRIREYKVLSKLGSTDRYTELLGMHQTMDVKKVLRVYAVPDLATETQREQLRTRASWEAKVMARLGHSPGLLQVGAFFEDEVGMVVPMEHFEDSVTLESWIARHHETLNQLPERGGTVARLDLWLRIARAMKEAHKQGVVHRLLRPEVVLVQDLARDPEVRITGFDLAKQVHAEATVAWSVIDDDRVRTAAPEVLEAASAAEFRSDQFSLGALLALILTGRLLFENTRTLRMQRRLLVRPRDLQGHLPLKLDEAITQMLSLRPVDRYPTLGDAIAAVEEVRHSLTARTRPEEDRPSSPDPDDLPDGTQLGRNYVVEQRLGSGGLSVVYKARHRISGQTRALKVAYAQESAEIALRREYEALRRLQHPAVVSVLDLSADVPERMTLVLEYVDGKTLGHWSREHTDPELATRRRYAEDLLSALDYFERVDLVHNDLKPDNLLLGANGLHVIDFSLAEHPELLDEELGHIDGGTAPYRDPAGGPPSHGSDRYAAALCLFELYAGRHPFDGSAPPPGEAPAIHDGDLEPAGLLPFFEKALAPEPAERFHTATQMREALLAALGEAVSPADVTGATEYDGRTPLSLVGLPSRAVRALRRAAAVTTVGELLALRPDQIRGVPGIGSSTARHILAFRQQALEQGLEPTETARSEPWLLADLVDCAEALSDLPLSEPLRQTLRDHGYRTVGQLAGANRSDLLRIPRVGRSTVTDIARALLDFQASSPGGRRLQTVDDLWLRASRPLTEEQREILDAAIGVTVAPPGSQSAVGARLGLSQGQVSRTCTAALERMDHRVLEAVATALDTLLELAGGIEQAKTLAARLEEDWPSIQVPASGIIRLLIARSADRFHLMHPRGFEEQVLVRPWFDAATLGDFADEAVRISAEWPPLDSSTARRALKAVLPELDRDPIALAARVVDHVALMEGGELFQPPILVEQALAHLLGRERLPIPLAALAERLDETFAGYAVLPEPGELPEILQGLGYDLAGDQVIEGRLRSISAEDLEQDRLPQLLGPEPTHAERVGLMLSEAAETRGFRLLVTPPGRHVPIARSVATSLDATWISFASEWFERHGDTLDRWIKAESFPALRRGLTRTAEALLQQLLETHGRPGRSIVLGDTGILGVMEATDLVRRLYDEVQSGDQGFWVVVVPGTIRETQPRFNGKVPLWHLPGVTLPLRREIPTR